MHQDFDLWTSARSGQLEGHLIFLRAFHGLWVALESKYNATLVPASCFISHMTQETPLTYHTQHADEASFPHFHYTGTFYLADAATHFTGGLFRWVSPGSLSSLAPRLGRASLFSSGWENVHQVDEITKGQRFAMSAFFTARKRSRATSSLKLDTEAKLRHVESFIAACLWAEHTHTALPFVRECLQKWPILARELSWNVHEGLSTHESS